MCWDFTTRALFQFSHPQVTQSLSGIFSHQTNEHLMLQFIYSSIFHMPLLCPARSILYAWCQVPMANFCGGGPLNFEITTVTMTEIRDRRADGKAETIT
jgi:hypothetical protein